VGALLRLAWLAFREQMYSKVAEAGYTDLQRAHVALFRYPTIADLRPSQLAEQAGLSKQSMNDLLRQLEAKGYIKLRPDRADRRAKRIALTDRGSELMELVRSAARQVSEEWAAVVGQDRIGDVRATLLALLESEIGQSPTG
jgi:DNA-binding MarR family transcriptional regulator